MIYLDQFHFIRPWALIAIVPAFILFWFMLRARKNSTQWSDVVSAHLLPHLLDAKETKNSILPFIGLLFIWVMACVSLAGPTFKKISAPLIQNESALVVLWDLSPSMRTQDLKPSRFERAKFKLVDLLNNNKQGVTGLIAYAGDAHIVTPLTDDVRTIKNLLNGLSPDVMPIAGSNPEMALSMAVELLKEGGATQGSILFLTDGIAPSSHPVLQDLVRKNNYEVIVWSIGTQKGAPIPLENNQGFVKNKKDGNIIVHKINDKELTNAAVSMKGAYIPFSNTSADVESIVKMINVNANPNTQNKTERVFDVWEESGIYLVFLLIPLVALCFRKGWLLSVFFAFFILPTEKTYASTWDSIWLNNTQEGLKTLNQDNPKAAIDVFEDNKWKAYSAYKAKEYKQAVELFENIDKKTLTEIDYYNAANSLTQLGDYDRAISLYDKSLDINPEFSSAEKNKSIAIKLKELAEQENKNENKNENSDGENSDNKDQDKSDKNDEKNSDSQSQNSNNENDSTNEKQGNSNQKNDNSQNSNNKNEPSSEDKNSDEAQSDQPKNLSDEDKDALNKKYDQNQDRDDIDEQQENELDNKNAQSEKQAQENSEDKDAADENQNKKLKTQQMSEAEKKESIDPRTKEEIEAQQTLEQWLRKVPDDPSQLMRNKFNYKSRNRRVEQQELFLKQNQPTERL